MFLMQRASVQSVTPAVRGHRAARASRHMPPRSARGGGVMAFAATFTAVVWIGGGVMLYGLAQDLRAEYARLANVATLVPQNCAPAPIAGAPVDTPLRLSAAWITTSQFTTHQGRSPLFAEAFRD